jgi:SAM-dependent methyltransferase
MITVMGSSLGYLLGGDRGLASISRPGSPKVFEAPTNTVTLHPSTSSCDQQMEAAMILSGLEAMMHHLRRKLARTIIIDRAPTKARSMIERIARRRAAGNYMFASRFVAGKDVLDIGGGEGTGHGYLLACHPTRVVSIDLHAGTGEKNPDSRLTYLHGDFLRHRFPDNSFDVLLCIGTIFLLQDHDAAFRKMHRLLRTGGILIINCINPELISRYFGMRLHDIDIKYSKSYTAGELNDTLVQHFHAIPDAYVQQPVAHPAGRYAAIRMWIAPLRWLFSGHSVCASTPRVVGMFNYFVVRKAALA